MNDTRTAKKSRYDKNLILYKHFCDRLIYLISKISLFEYPKFEC